MKKKTVKPDRICFECLHYEACQSWNIGSLVKTAADNCVNYRASVDVRPVVSTTWCDDGLYGMIEGRFYSCPVCKAQNVGKSNYCPNCGANMREVIANGN